jgi:hypothetical protein
MKDAKSGWGGFELRLESYAHKPGMAHPAPLVSYWARIFPNHFAFVPVPGAEPFFTQIAYGRVSTPLRPRAMKAFDEFFFSRAKDVYPRYDFARMNDDEYGASLALE